MNDKELEAYEKQLARIDYASYVEYVHKGHWKPAKHLQYVCKHIEEVEKGNIQRLMIFMPPQNGKSKSVSETFPSYFIGKNPNRKIIVASYGDSLAQRFGRLNRQKIEEFGQDLFGIEIAKSNASVTNWSIYGQQGGMISAGIGGGITGEGADLLIIDDPIKNMLEASSQTYRERVWSEWESTLSTRLHPNSRVIIILTRWHEDDLAGRLLSTQGEDWTVIKLPAIAEENDQIGRAEGEPLWPDYGYTIDFLDKVRKNIGGRTWASLYQQRPSPSEGTLFNRSWWKYYKVLPTKFNKIVQSWDCAFKDGKENDFVVGQVWGQIGAEKYLIDQVRGKMGITATIQAIRNMSAKYPLAHAKYVEDKANGTAVIELLQREIPGLIPVNPEGGKEVRAQAVLPTIEARNVYLPDPSIAPWINDFVEECAAFPNSKNDDQVDSMTQALNKLITRVSIGNPENYIVGI